MFASIDRSSLDNRMARHARRANWNMFAGLACLPLMFALCAVFDPGAAGTIIRAALELAIN